jgi:hypothetical protein
MKQRERVQIYSIRYYFHSNETKQGSSLKHIISWFNNSIPDGLKKYFVFVLLE